MTWKVCCDRILVATKIPRPDIDIANKSKQGNNFKTRTKLTSNPTNGLTTSNTNA